MFSPLGNAIVEAILKQQADYKDACTKASHFTNKSSTWTPYINGVEHFPKINQALLFSLSPISLSTSSSGGRFLPGRKLSFLYFSSLHNFFSVSALLFGVGNRLPVSINKCTQGFSGHIMRSFFFFFFILYRNHSTLNTSMKPLKLYCIWIKGGIVWSKSVKEPHMEFFRHFTFVTFDT